MPTAKTLKNRKKNSMTTKTHLKRPAPSARNPVQAASTKRRIVDTDDEVEEDDSEIDEDAELSAEEQAEVDALNAKLVAGEEADDDEEEADENESALDEKSTEEAVEAMDETRPWEKAAAKSGKAWADRGDTVRDAELVAAAAELERENERVRKERFAEQTDDIRDVKPPRDRGEKRYTGAAEGARGDRFERPRKGAGRVDRHPAKEGAGKPWEKRGGSGASRGGAYDARKPADGERRPREYGDKRGHTPRAWEKTKEGGSDRPRSFGKPGGFDRSGGERKPWVKREGSGGGDARGERKPWVKREGSGSDRGGDRPRSFSKPGGFDKAGGGFPRRDDAGGERKPWVKREGSSGGGDSRGERKPWVKREGGGTDRGGDRPRSFSKPGGFDRSGGERKPWVKREGGGGDSRGERKPWVKREGGGGPRRRPTAQFQQTGRQLPAQRRERFTR